MKKVALFFGGMSSEHDISCLSATTVAEGLAKLPLELYLVGITKDGKWLLAKDAEEIRSGAWRNSRTSAQLLPERGAGLLLKGPEGLRQIPVDIAFPELHGRYGEDGAIQGLFELAGIPYVGANVVASGVCMDKLYTKVLVEQTGVAQARYLGFTKAELEDEQTVTRQVEQAFTYPVFVKPNDGGSSQGVSRVDDRAGLLPALRLAASEGSRVMVEEAIVGRELECAVLSLPEGPAVTGPGEILAAAEFYDFDAKYTNPASQTTTEPTLPAGKAEELRRAAELIYKAVGAYGLSRVDFFLEKGTERVIFNEVNTLPGFTSISMYPKLWEAAGMPLSELLQHLLDSAERR